MSVGNTAVLLICHSLRMMDIVSRRINKRIPVHGHYKAIEEERVVLCYDMSSSLPASSTAGVVGTWELWTVSASVSGKRPLWCQSRWPDRPSQSPDLNPIEHHWRDLNMSVHQRSPSNLTELEDLQGRMAEDPQTQEWTSCCIIPKKIPGCTSSTGSPLSKGSENLGPWDISLFLF